ncbi:MAG: NACHT domain-containing protein [Phormidium tanganyikae FI6-MK23]|jgi:predicted NACHT family NTPase|nr:NACHT domain-containing protein [Phormidium tanganyikae FI6-MK23]
MDRGIRASIAGIESAKKALKLKGWTQEYLAGASQCSRQTLNRFLKGIAIEPRIFQAICTELELRWNNIAELEEGSEPVKQTLDIDALVQKVRKQISEDIQKRCGTMRVLDMEQPITIDSIYTTVNILEKVSSYQRISVENLLDGCDLTNFDRLSLGRVRQERIPGVEAVQRHDKLLILGKPGAGKTTFLKWLTLQCKEGELFPDRVPMFVTLKEFAEASGQPTLLEFVGRQFEECGIETALDMVKHLLRSGRGFVFLDGLDEVRVEDSDRVLNTIRRTSELFERNQFVMTCRIAAKEYTFTAFTEVEVADFNEEQIADFTNKWFLPNDPTKAEEFPKELEKHPACGS